VTIVKAGRDKRDNLLRCEGNYPLVERPLPVVHYDANNSRRGMAVMAKRPKPVPTPSKSSILKRGVVGTFHKMSAKYLPLYVAEFQFRYNNRTNPDMFGTAIAGC
jgi:hypothetical protein